MKLAITGITGMRNRGVEAIVVPTVEQLRQRQPDAKIHLLTMTPDYDRIRLAGRQLKIDPESKHLKPLPPGRKQQLLAKFLPSYQLPPPLPASYVIRQASAVIASGGDMFSPEYNVATPLKPLKMALNADVPVIFLAQSISPYKTDEQAELWLEVARRAKLITIREKVTYHYVTQVLGLSTDIVKLTADPAFLLPALPIDRARSLLASYGISGNRPIVAIAPSQGICGYGSIDDRDRHLESWQKVIKTILDEFEADVLIIPHVQEIQAQFDDRIIATELLRGLNYDPRVHIAAADHTASEYKGAIAACDLVIAERMHAAIAGLSSGVCTVAVGYSVKAEGIISDLVSADLLSQGLLISIGDFVDANLACQAIRFAWDKRQDIAAQIKEALPGVKQRSADNFDLVLKALG